MASSTKTYCYDGKKPFTLLKWKIRKGSQLFCNSVILNYTDDEKSGDGKDPQLKYKSNIGGTVLELIASEGDVVHCGAELLKLQPCTHPVVMKDLCAECGIDLRHLDRDNFEKLTASNTFSMVHVVPELKVSLEQAEKLGRDDEDRLLKNKKLVLLVDLDQTLIHTTNDNVPQDLPNVHHFQLYGSFSPWYHTKLRPGTAEFLEKISKYYELHICTFGARLYAHKIAKILDPDGKYFSHRILSRDECFDATSKTGNLKALFPRGDNMVCIIDDREDVWNFAPNVVHVKPFCYFRNTGDINSPLLPPIMNPRCSQTQFPSVASVEGPPIVVSQNSLSPPSAQIEIEQSPSTNSDSPPPQENNVSPTEQVTDKTEEPSPSASNADESVVTEEKPEESKDTQVEPEQAPTEPVTKAVDSDPPKQTDEDSSSKSDKPTNCTVKDQHHSDDYLLYLEEILINIHKTYYNHYRAMQESEDKTIPDLKTIVPLVRKRILMGVNIVFSSVIPVNSTPETHQLWTLAESLGARVSKELEFDDEALRTTHVVASKHGTAKVNTARRIKSVHVVNLDWLLCCAERWEHVDERCFPLAGDSGAPVERLKRVKRHHTGAGSRRRRERQAAQDRFCESIFIEAGLSLSQEDIEDMDKEVDEACSEESDEGKDDHSSSSESSSSSAESLSSGDYPRGWKKRRKCEDGQQEDSMDSSDADTIGSVDEEMAEAVKQEFGNF